MTAQVKGYNVEDGGQLTPSKKVRKAIEKKGGDATKVKKAFEVLHIFDLK